MNVIEYLIDNIIEDFQTGELLHIRSILIPSFGYALLI